MMETMRLLQTNGIACGPVLNSRDLLMNEQLRHRGFYEMVEHPLPVGRRPIITRPYRLRFRDARIRKPAPRFGEDNRRILRELAGLGEDEVKSLMASQVVCDDPTNPGLPRTLNIEAMLQLRTLIAMDANYREKVGIVG